jgi:hypothetical protein
MLGRKEYVAEIVELAICVDVPQEWAAIERPEDFLLMKLFLELRRRKSDGRLWVWAVRRGKERMAWKYYILARLRYWSALQILD